MLWNALSEPSALPTYRTMMYQVGAHLLYRNSTIYPFYRVGNWGSEGLSDLSMDTELADSQAGAGIEVFSLLALSLQLRPRREDA